MGRFSLIGVDGNAFCVMGYTARAMRRSGFTQDEIDKMYEEAESGDYNNLLCVCNDYVEKCNEKMGYTEDDEEEE
jgi:hypothetical protein